MAPAGFQTPAGALLSRRQGWGRRVPRFGLSGAERPPIVCVMFCVDEATAAAVRQVYEANGELSAAVEPVSVKIVAA